MIRWQGFTQTEIFALMVANSPNPSEQHIESQHRLDHYANPHNDPLPKKPRRSREEIVAEYKIEHARVLMKAAEKAT